MVILLFYDIIHEFFMGIHEGFAAEFAWHEHVGGSLIVGNDYNSGNHDSPAHVAVNVDLLGSLEVGDCVGMPGLQIVVPRRTWFLSIS